MTKTLLFRSDSTIRSRMLRDDKRAAEAHLPFTRLAKGFSGLAKVGGGNSGWQSWESQAGNIRNSGVRGSVLKGWPLKDLIYTVDHN